MIPDLEGHSSVHPRIMGKLSEEQMRDMNLILESTESANHYTDHFTRLIPHVDLVKELYHNWLKLLPSLQRQTKNHFLANIIRNTPAESDAFTLATLPQRLAYHLIQAYENWTHMQDTLGACGIDPDLVSINSRQENDLYKIVNLIHDAINHLQSRNRRQTCGPISLKDLDSNVQGGTGDTLCEADIIQDEDPLTLLKNQLNIPITPANPPIRPNIRPRQRHTICSVASETDASSYIKVNINLRAAHIKEKLLSDVIVEDSHYSSSNSSPGSIAASTGGADEDSPNDSDGESSSKAPKWFHIPK